jgi:hypothetical protein
LSELGKHRAPGIEEPLRINGPNLYRPLEMAGFTLINPRTAGPHEVIDQHQGNHRLAHRHESR